MKNIGIIGLGLIGSSLSSALKKYSQVKIWGYDINSDHVDYNINRNIIDEILEKKYINKMDIIFIAVPVCSVKNVIKNIFPHLNSNTIVTDMGSTKHNITTEINNNFPSINFIGGHPMAGKEVSGPEAADPDLFKDKTYILINDKINNENNKDDNILKNNLNHLKSLLSSLGCKVKIMDSKTHDQLVAVTSHLPQITASTLIEELISRENDFPDISELVGTGFLDMTRIAAGNPEMWLDIFITNKKNIINEIDGIIDKLKKFKNYIENEDENKINKIMSRTKDKRNNLE